MTSYRSMRGPSFMYTVFGWLALKYQPSPELQLYGLSAENIGPRFFVSPVFLL